MTYRMTKTLPATRVTRDLIKRIEDLIKSQIEELVKNKDDFEKNISRIAISVADKMGVEEFRFSDAIPQKFPSDTEFVAISFDGAWGTEAQGLSISVNFDKKRPRISVIFSGKNAKTIALGISESILSVVRAYGNSNSWAHYPGLILIVTSLLAVFLNLVVMTRMVPEKAILVVVSVFAFIVISQAIYTFLLPWLAPYTTYESFRDDSGADWRRWTIRAMIAAFVLSPIAALVYSFF